ncbi:hypothetical protein [Lentilactobacillus parakefiri]|nr:hypothetical protein [Lentilactobacillus parakefiri]
MIRLMFAYFVSVRPFDLKTADEDIAKAGQKNDEVALENPLNISKYRDEAADFIDQLETFSAQAIIPFNAQHLCFKLTEMIDDPVLTPSGADTQMEQEAF